MHLPDTMDSNELIRKLYDEGTDPSELEAMLSEEERLELRRVVEVKRALEDLPRRGPAKASLDAVLEHAGSPPDRRPGLFRIVGGGFLPRFAAAAAVLIAVGVGYLVLSTSGPQVHMSDLEVAAPAPSDDEPALAKEGAQAARESFKPETSPKSTDFAAELQEEQLADSVIPRRRNEPGMSAMGARGLMAGTGSESGTPASAWEDDEVFQTFYWQVQALSERSPDDGWDEAVPLEGPFEALDGDDERSTGLDSVTAE